ncbi:hypothetical protein CDIK_1769 [Cucumispora dikerogammari]|nr:hypothetical protein CDIK_1769 [Cucumispora dikerogammari]
MSLLLSALITSLASLTYKLNKNKSELIVGKSVLENQLVSGFIEIHESDPNAEQNFTYSLLIFNEENNQTIHLKKKNLKVNEKLPFSFTTSEKQNITVKILYKPALGDKKVSRRYFSTTKAKIEINADYDFFNQKVVEKQFNSPITRLMINYSNVLKVSAKKYFQMDKEIEYSIKSFRLIFTLVFLLAIVIFVVFLVTNVWQARQIKEHFKQKKLI